MRNRFPASSYVAAALAICSSLAQAAPSGSAVAELSGFKIELIDLDANDGVTPMLTFLNSSGYGDVRISTAQGGDFQTIHVPGSIEVGNTFGLAQGAIGNTGVSAKSIVFDVANPGAISFSTESRYYESFSLTRNTGMRMTALGSVKLAENGQDVNGYVSVTMGGFFFDHFTPSGFPMAAENQFFSIDPINTSFGMSASLDSGATDVTGRWYLHGITNLYAPASTISPVPEPATYMMLLGGIAALALARRRKARPGI